MARAVGSSIVSKCTNIVDILTEARKPLAFSDIVDATGFVKSSAHRVLSVLISEELVHYDTHSRTYSIGARVNRWARASWLRADLQNVATKEMERLCDATKMNIALSVMDHDAILYIKTLDSIRMRFAARPGDHAPLHCTAAGKVFLTYMNEFSREEFFEKVPLQKYTDSTIVQKRLLLKDLEKVRDNGFAISVKEEIPHVLGVAAPIWDNDDMHAACISVWSVAERSEVKDMQDVVPMLLDSAQRISSQLA